MKAMVLELQENPLQLVDWPRPEPVMGQLFLG